MFFRDVVKKYKLQLESFSLFFKKNPVVFFQRVVQCYNRSPREETDAPCSDTSKACLNKGRAELI